MMRGSLFTLLLIVLVCLVGCAELPLARHHASAGCVMQVTTADSNRLTLLVDDFVAQLPSGLEGLETAAGLWAGTFAARMSEAHLDAIHLPREFHRELQLRRLEVITDPRLAFDNAQLHFDETERKLDEGVDVEVILRWQIMPERARDGSCQLRVLTRSTGWFRSAEEEPEAALAHECFVAGLSSALVERARTAFVAAAQQHGYAVHAQCWGPGRGQDAPPDEP